MSKFDEEIKLKISEYKKIINIIIDIIDYLKWENIKLLRLSLDILKYKHSNINNFTDFLIEINNNKTINDEEYDNEITILMSKKRCENNEHKKLFEKIRYLSNNGKNSDIIYKINLFTMQFINDIEKKCDQINKNYNIISKYSVFDDNFRYKRDILLEQSIIINKIEDKLFICKKNYENKLDTLNSLIINYDEINNILDENKIFKYTEFKKLLTY